MYLKDIPIGDYENADVVRVQLREYKKNLYLDVRRFYVDTSDPNMELKPTKKGISIHEELMREVVNAILEAWEEVEKE